MTGDDNRITAGAYGSATSAPFSLRQFGGAFAFRFAGFTVLNDILYRLAGLGQFQIDPTTGAIAGKQRSSYTAMQGSAQLKTGEFSIAGKISIQADGTGSATLTFTKTSGDGRGVKGDFNVLAAGSAERIWLVSSGGVVLDTDEPADELVDGEAVRIIAA